MCLTAHTHLSKKEEYRKERQTERRLCGLHLVQLTPLPALPTSPRSSGSQPVWAGRTHQSVLSALILVSAVLRSNWRRHTCFAVFTRVPFSISNKNRIFPHTDCGIVPRRLSWHQRYPLEGCGIFTIFFLVVVVGRLSRSLPFKKGMFLFIRRGPLFFPFSGRKAICLDRSNPAAANQLVPISFFCLSSLLSLASLFSF